mgnify:CR=1 FL=1
MDINFEIKTEKIDTAYLKLRLFSGDKVILKIRRTYLIPNLGREPFNGFGGSKKIYLDNSCELYTANFVGDEKNKYTLDEFKLFFVVIEDEKAKKKYSCAIILNGNNKGAVNIRELQDNW